MPYQNISAKLTEADLRDIKAALATIETKLPFLIHLTVEERRKLFKMGNKSLAFVNNSLAAAQSNPDILPASFDLDEFSSDYQLAITLTEVHTRLQHNRRHPNCSQQRSHEQQPHRLRLCKNRRQKDPRTESDR